MIVDQMTEKGHVWRWAWLDEKELSEAELEEWDACLARWDVLVSDPQKAEHILVLWDNPRPRFAGLVTTPERAKKFEELFEREIEDRLSFNQCSGSGDERWAPLSPDEFERKFETDLWYRYRVTVAAIRDFTRRSADRAIISRAADYGFRLKNLANKPAKVVVYEALKEIVEQGRLDSLLNEHGALTKFYEKLAENTGHEAQSLARLGRKTLAEMRAEKSALRG